MSRHHMTQHHIKSVISTNRTAECSISVYSFRRVFSAVSFLLVYPQFPYFKITSAFFKNLYNLRQNHHVELCLQAF